VVHPTGGEEDSRDRKRNDPKQKKTARTYIKLNKGYQESEERKKTEGKSLQLLGGKEKNDRTFRKSRKKTAQPAKRQNLQTY